MVIHKNLIKELKNFEILQEKEKMEFYKKSKSNIKNKKKVFFYPEIECLEYYDLNNLLILFRFYKNLLKKTQNNKPLRKSLSRNFSDLKKLTNNLIKGKYIIEHLNSDNFLVKKVNYGFKKQSKIGRLYSNELSALYLSRQLRYFLFKDFYFDVDIINAHPSILLYYLKKHKLEKKFKTIVYYAVYRDKIFDNFKFLEKKYIKGLFIRHLNLEKPYENYYNLPIELINMLKTLVSELNILRNILYNDKDLKFIRDILEENKIIPKTKVTTKHKITFQSLFVQSIESDILTDFFDFCKKQNIEQPIPFFDGCYIRKTCLSKEDRENVINSYVNNSLNKKYSTIKFKISEIPPEDVPVLIQGLFNRYFNSCKLDTDAMRNLKLKNSPFYTNWLENSEGLSNKLSKRSKHQRIFSYKALVDQQKEILTITTPSESKD